MIRLLPERAMTYDVPFIKEMKPYAHQIVQLQLIEKVLAQGRQAVIWNQALTGAGKTLANYSYLSKQPHSYALGVYPVNELIKDQYHSLKKGLALGAYETISLWSSGELRKERKPKETILDQMNRLSGKYTRSILTNPDYLMLIAQERLGAGYALAGQRSSPFYRLGEYNLQIFDEFHLYTISQVNLLVQWIALMVAAFPNKAHAFVLASATPRPEIIQLLERSGIEILYVQEETQRWLKEEKPFEYGERMFLEPLLLNLRSSQLHYWQTAEKILQNWGEVEEYLHHFPEAKGLIILDSIHEAQTLAKGLREKGYEVGEVHGLSDRKNSRTELAKPLTVATATVEVGVDFQDEIHKDFLLFEARNAGSFMQRIGRIGRGNRENPKIPLNVWAYAPKYVIEQMRDQLGEEASRTRLQTAVQNAYKRFQHFIPYLEKVGGMNLIHSYYQLKKHYIDREQNPALDTLKRVTENLYQLGFEAQNSQYQEWKKKQLLEPVISFRGQNTMESYLWTRYEREMEKEGGKTFYPDIWFWDETNPTDPLKRYNYQFVLRRRSVAFISKEEMIEKVKNHYPHEQLEEKLYELKRQPVLGHAIVMGIRDRAVRLFWKLPHAANRCTEQLVRLKKLQLESDDPRLNEQLHVLFQSLKDKSWIVYIVKKPPQELFDTLYLPPMFRLHHAKSARGRDWSMAFNVEAFQLWSVWEQVHSEVL